MDSKLIDIVGKLVNRATSDNIEESEAAARGALGRLARSGETFEAYLGSVDPEKVFQSGLMRVADRYAFGRDDLSEPAKRDLYSLLVRAIASKYSGPADPSGTESAKEEELRRREEELDRRDRESSERENARHERENAGSRTGPDFSFSPARRWNFPKEISVWRSDPAEAFRIYSAGLLFGFFAAVAITLASAFAFAWYGEVPEILRRIPVSALLAAVGIPFGILRVWAEFRPAAREIFQRFP